jgi:maltose O-acetyltransferase
VVSTCARTKMLVGELYDAGDAELVAARAHARRLTARYNATLSDDEEERRQLLAELFADVAPGVWAEPPFHCDYGCNITAGERAFLNFGCVALDCAPVEIGANAKLGPYVQLCTATHPLDPAQREAALEYALPIHIGRNVWIGAGAIVGPGVTVGENSVVGAGSVVLRDVPANVVAVGNPCRVLRPL